MLVVDVDLLPLVFVVDEVVVCRRT